MKIIAAVGVLASTASVLVGVGFAHAGPLDNPLPVAPGGQFTLAVQGEGDTGAWIFDISDLNGDGQDDIVMTSFVGGRKPVPLGGPGFTVFMNRTREHGGKLSFEPRHMNIAESTQGVRIGDLDGDGKPDIAIGWLGGLPGRNSAILRNITPKGAPWPIFEKPFMLPSGLLALPAEMFRIADINADGKPDLIGVNTVNIELDAVSIYMNESKPGHLKFEFTNIPAAFGAQSMIVDDLNGDGKPDLFVTSSTINFQDTLWVNDTPKGAMKPRFIRQTRIIDGIGPSTVEAIDLNGDGLKDIVVGHLYDPRMQLTVFMNHTARGSKHVVFGHVTHIFSGLANTYLKGDMDLDGDGKPDLVCTNFGVTNPLGITLTGIPPVSGSVAVFLNRTPKGSSKPVFTPPLFLNSGEGGWFVKMHDFEHNGYPDLVVSNTLTTAIGKLTRNGMVVLHNNLRHRPWFPAKK
jgi:hypothetical protein